MELIVDLVNDTRRHTPPKLKLCRYYAAHNQP